MTKSKIHHDVILTTEALSALQNEVVFPMLRDNKYFNCLKVEPNGYFTDLIVEFIIGGKKHLTELSIPSHYILYIISALQNKKIGFKE